MSKYMRLFRLAISVFCEGKERDEEKRKKKEKLTGNLVSILKRTYESLMQMLSQSTSCMILIHRLDKLLGPSSMNLEHNWSHCIVVS